MQGIKTNIIKVINIVFAVLTSSSLCFGQNEIVLKKTSKGSEVTEIVFKQKSSDIVLKTLNLNEINPYRNGLATKSENDSIAQVTLVNNIANFNSGVAISFNYNPQTAENYLIEDQCEATVIAFGSDGEEMFRTVIEAYDVGEPVLSADGNFLAVTYGGLVPEGGGVDVPVGFRIYDVKSNSIWYEESVPEVYIMDSNNILVISVPIPKSGRSVDKYIFDSRNHALYKKRYSSKEIGLILRYENDGVVLKLFPDGERKELYSAKFEIVK